MKTVMIGGTEIAIDSPKELSDDEITELLKTQDRVVDTIVVGGEEFYRRSSMYLGKRMSFVIGCYGDRYVHACERENREYEKKRAELIRKGKSPIQKVMVSLGYKLELEDEN